MDRTLRFRTKRSNVFGRHPQKRKFPGWREKRDSDISSSYPGRRKKKWPAIRFHRMSSGYGEFQDKVVSRPNGSVSSRNLPWRRAYLKNSHQCYLFPALVRRWHKIDSFARWKEETPTISMQSAIHLRSSPGWIATKKLAPRIQEFCDIMALHRGARYYGKLRRFCASFKTLRGENLVPSHNCT